MFSAEHNAEALATAKAIYNDGFQRIDYVAAALRLDRYGLFSLQAVAAILHMKAAKVRPYVTNGIRGTLNPDHLDFLMYMLDGTVRNHWLDIMLGNGTSLNTIERLTGISRSTLYRKKWDGKASNL